MQSMNETCRRSTTTVRRPLARPASSAPSSSGAVERSTSPSACTTNTPPRSSTATASGVPASSKSASKSGSKSASKPDSRSRGRWGNGRAGRAVAVTRGSGDRVDEASEELRTRATTSRAPPGAAGLSGHSTTGPMVSPSIRLITVCRRSIDRVQYGVVVHTSGWWWYPEEFGGFHRRRSVRRSLASCSARPSPRQGAPHAHCLPGIGMDRRGGGLVQAAAIAYAIFGLGDWIQERRCDGQGRHGERGVGLHR